MIDRMNKIREMIKIKLMLLFSGKRISKYIQNELAKIEPDISKLKELRQKGSIDDYANYKIELRKRLERVVKAIDELYRTDSRAELIERNKKDIGKEMIEYEKIGKLVKNKKRLNIDEIAKVIEYVGYDKDAALNNLLANKIIIFKKYNLLEEKGKFFGQYRFLIKGYSDKKLYIEDFEPIDGSIGYELLKTRIENVLNNHLVFKKISGEKEIEVHDLTLLIDKEEKNPNRDKILNSTLRGKLLKYKDEKTEILGFASKGGYDFVYLQGLNTWVVAEEKHLIAKLDFLFMAQKIKELRQKVLEAKPFDATSIEALLDELKKRRFEDENQIANIERWRQLVHAPHKFTKEDFRLLAYLVRMKKMARAGEEKKEVKENLERAS